MISAALADRIEAARKKDANYIFEKRREFEEKVAAVAARAAEKELKEVDMGAYFSLKSKAYPPYLLF